MSGGVDSSVAAALLKKRGFDVVGVFMKPWQPRVASQESMDHRQGKVKNKPLTIVSNPLTACLWQRDREDAMRVAAKLGIPLLTWDFSKEYKKEVTDYMIREYKTGRTPNPDVMCNKHIKFGLFLRKALKEGADYIATGHYVRIRPITNNQRPMTRKIQSKKSSAISHRLFVARDKNKDQSYFLWTLTQDQLKHCLFPIGDYTKPEVRQMARKFGLPTADKKDSQGVCFVGPLDMKNFLKNYIKPEKGEILDTKGNLVGSHDGIFYYTIGQRHGLDIKNGQGPYYVVSKDIKKNIIYVGSEKELGGQTARVKNLNWVSEKSKLPGEISIKIRYRSESIPARLTIHHPLSTIHFLKQPRAVTPGQSAVFYRDDELLGGGIIA